MSEASMASWAIPLHRLADPTHRAIVARRLGIHIDDLAELLGSDGGNRIPFDLAYEEDSTTIVTIDEITCLCWSVTHCAVGGEGTAINFREHHIPYLRWWCGSSVYSAGMEAYTGLADPLLVRCDDDLQPIVGMAVRSGQYGVDASELAEANDYLAARRWILTPQGRGNHG